MKNMQKNSEKLNSEANTSVTNVNKVENKNKNVDEIIGKNSNPCEEKNNNNSMAYRFLKEIQALRQQQKGNYLSPNFSVKLEEVARKISETIAQQNINNESGFSKKTQAPEKIADSSVDLCLECMEMYLQKVAFPKGINNDNGSTSNCASSKTTAEPDHQDQEWQVLEHISSDLNTLATYIKYTLDI